MIKCFLGDNYITNLKLKKHLPESINPMYYMESDTFGQDENFFIKCINLWDTQKKILVIKQGSKLEDKNDSILNLVNSRFDKADVYIIAEQVNKSRKLYKALLKNNLIEDCTLTVQSAEMIINDTSAARGLNWDNGALELFKNRIGLFFEEKPSGGSIVNFINRIADVSNIASKDLVMQITQEVCNSNIWDMKKAFITGNSTEVMKYIAKYGDNNPIGILSALVGDFRIAYKLSLFKDDPTIQKLIGTKRVPYKLSSYSSEQLGMVIDELVGGISRIKKGEEKRFVLRSVMSSCLSTLK